MLKEAKILGERCNLLEIARSRLFTYTGQNWPRYSAVKPILSHLGNNNNDTNSDNYNL